MHPAPFTGFPPAAIEFLRDLAANNHKAFWDAHKALYVEAVQTPAVALVAALGEGLQAYFPTITYDTRVNGSGNLMRPYRDTRFSADKTPYKTNVAMMFADGAGKKMERPGFGLQMTTEEFGLVAGCFTFAKPVLATYRAAVLDEKAGAALEAAAAQVRAAGAYTFAGATYKRVPSGFPADHPRADWLKYSGLAVFAPPLALEVAQTPALVDVVLGHWRNMGPIWQWLTDHL
jgi:uncharacterized protein (TIGR02453 family)